MKTSRRRAVRMAVAPNAHTSDGNAKSIVPYPDLSYLEKCAVEDAIIEAGRRLPAAAARCRIDLATAAEEPITRLLRDELDLLRRDESSPVPGFSEDSFQHIPESEGVPDAGGRLDEFGTHFPDLVFRPVRTPRQARSSVEYGLFVECKIVDLGKDHHSIRYYCNRGILRFVSGDYAGAMPSAMIIAYVRGHCDVATHLGQYLIKDEHALAFQVVRPPTPSPRLAGSAVIALYASRHARSKVRVWGTYPPGDIELVHLWLRL